MLLKVSKLKISQKASMKSHGRSDSLFQFFSVTTAISPCTSSVQEEEGGIYISSPFSD